MKKKRIVILGSGGFISSAVEKLLRTSNFKIIALKRRSFDLEKNNSALKLKKKIKPNDIVFFVAADAPVKTFEQFEKNIKICSNICKVLTKVKIKKLIYLSSDAVYSDTKQFINEQSDTNPVSLHGLMHLTREKMLSKVIQNKYLCIVRPTLIFGKMDPHNGYGPNKFFREVGSAGKINLFGKGEELRDHISIRDVARLILIIIKKNKYGVYNLVTGKTYSFLSIAKMICELNGKVKKIIFNKRLGPKPHGGLRKFNNNKIKKEFKKFRFLKLKDSIKEQYYND